MKSQKQCGFVLLYVSLISSMLLAIALAVYNINIKELLLSSTARESQFAFYAADVGIECALFHDFQNDAFSIVTPSASVDCASQTWTVTPSGSNGGIPDDPDDVGDYVRAFRIDPISSLSSSCVDVIVTKSIDASGNRSTTIESRGKTSCGAGNLRRVERAIRSSY